MTKFDVELNHDTELWEVTWEDGTMMEFFSIEILRDYLDWIENETRLQTKNASGNNERPQNEAE